LTALIRVMEKTGAMPCGPRNPQQRLDHKVPGHALAHGVTDDPAAAQILVPRQVEPTLIGANIGDHENRWPTPPAPGTASPTDNRVASDPSPRAVQRLLGKVRGDFFYYMALHPHQGQFPLDPRQLHFHVSQGPMRRTDFSSLPDLKTSNYTIILNQ
jgi:hypothetical protein